MGEQPWGRVSLFKSKAHTYEQDTVQDQVRPGSSSIFSKWPNETGNNNNTNQLDSNQLELLKQVSAALINLRNTGNIQLEYPQPLEYQPQAEYEQQNVGSTQQLNNILLQSYPPLPNQDIVGRHVGVGDAGYNIGAAEDIGGGGGEDSSSAPRTVDYHDGDDGNSSRKRRARTPLQQERNKLAQQRYRERCKTKYKEMEQAISKYNNRIMKLENENKYLRDNEQSLRHKIQQLQNENKRLRTSPQSQQNYLQQANLENGQGVCGEGMPIVEASSISFQQVSTQLTAQQGKNLQEKQLSSQMENDEEEQLQNVLISTDLIQQNIENILKSRQRRRLADGQNDNQRNGDPCSQAGITDVEKECCQQGNQDNDANVLSLGKVTYHSEEERLSSEGIGVQTGQGSTSPLCCKQSGIGESLDKRSCEHAGQESVQIVPVNENCNQDSTLNNQHPDSSTTKFNALISEYLEKDPSEMDTTEQTLRLQNAICGLLQLFGICNNSPIMLIWKSITERLQQTQQQTNSMIYLQIRTHFVNFAQKLSAGNVGIEELLQLCCGILQVLPQDGGNSQ